MKKILKVRNLDCANCAAKIEHAISKLDGVIDVKVNFMHQKIVIEAPDERIEAVLAEARKTAGRIEAGIEFIGM